MGWSFSWLCKSKQQTVNHLLLRCRESSGITLLDHAVRARCLWLKIQDKTTSEIGIVLYLLQPGCKDDPDWGWKAIGEEDGPAYYSCPVTFLKGLPPPKNHHAAAWRNQVVKEHEDSKASQTKKSELKAGVSMLKYGGEEYLLVERLGPKGWNVRRVKDGQEFRMKNHQVTRALQTAAA